MKTAQIKRLAELIHYDPSSGSFTWLSSPKHGVRVGDRAGTVCRGGYLVIGHRRALCKAHRLAFFIMTGNVPSHGVDHVDGDPLNNAWSNLRECSPAENAQNAKIQKNNTSRLPGVTWHKRRSKWVAAIRVNYRPIHLGYFEDKLEAYAAYLSAKAKFHPFAPLGCNLPFTDMLKIADKPLEVA